MEQENLGTIIMDDVLLLCKLNKGFEAQLILIAQTRMNIEKKGNTNGIRKSFLRVHILKQHLRCQKTQTKF